MATMTLIVTLVSTNKVVQVSDRLLTLDGKPHDVNATKDVGVACDDAHFFVGYTGVAEIDGQRMDYWIVDRVSDIFSAGHRDVISVSNLLMEEASSAISKLRYAGRPVHWRGRGLTLQFAGYAERWGLVVPFTALISNMAPDNPFQVQRRLTKEMWAYKPNDPPDKQVVYVIGARAALTSGDATSKRLLKRYWETMRLLRRIDLGYRPDATTTVERLVWLVRQAQKHPKHGKVIGRVCSSAVTHPDNPGMPCGYHSEQSTTKEYLPHLVTPMLVTSDIRIDFDPQLPDERTKDAEED